MQQDSHPPAIPEVSAYLQSSPAPLASDSNRKKAAAWPALLMTVPLLSLTVGLGTLGSRRPSSQPFSPRTYLGPLPSLLIAAIPHSRLRSSTCWGPFLSAGDRRSFFLQPALRGIEANRCCPRTKPRSGLSQTSQLEPRRQVSNLTVPRGRRTHAPPFLRTRAPSQGILGLVVYPGLALAVALHNGSCSFQNLRYPSRGCSLCPASKASL